MVSCLFVCLFGAKLLWHSAWVTSVWVEELTDQQLVAFYDNGEKLRRWVNLTLIPTEHTHRVPRATLEDENEIKSIQVQTFVSYIMHLLNMLDVSV